MPHSVSEASFLFIALRKGAPRWRKTVSRPHRKEERDDPAQAKREAEIQPTRVADDLGRKPVAGVAWRTRRCHLVRLRDLAHHCKPLTWRCPCTGSRWSRRCAPRNDR